MVWQRTEVTRGVAGGTDTGLFRLMAPERSPTEAVSSGALPTSLKREGACDNHTMDRIAAMLLGAQGKRLTFENLIAD